MRWVLPDNFSVPVLPVFLITVQSAKNANGPFPAPYLFVLAVKKTRTCLTGQGQSSSNSLPDDRKEVLATKNRCEDLSEERKDFLPRYVPDFSRTICIRATSGEGRSCSLDQVQTSRGVNPQAVANAQNSSAVNI
jgi:hypothetical protein